MVDPSATAASGHGLPERFSSSGSPAPHRSRRRRRALRRSLLAAGGVALVAGGFVALQLSASTGYDDALASERRAQEAQQTSIQQVQAGLVPSRSATQTVESVLKTEDGGLIDAADRAALEAAQAQAVHEQKGAEKMLPGAADEPAAKPFWFWDLYRGADRLREDAKQDRANATALTESAQRVEVSTHSLQSSAATAISAAADRAAAAEGANVPAKNESVLALRFAVSQTKELSSPLREQLSSAYPALVLAAQRLQDSHAATLAAEAGPLADSRAQIEEFARSLAPGVLLDFEWADLVNGLGSSNGYLSGETGWRYDRGGYATIRLSNSIAEYWPDDSSHAIVAHEVGHAITVRCYTMYDTTDRATAEAWATAWAISMGFTDDANGTYAYGSPPDSLIQTASGCR